MDPSKIYDLVRRWVWRLAGTPSMSQITSHPKGFTHAFTSIHGHEAASSVPVSAWPSPNRALLGAELLSTSVETRPRSRT